MKKNRNQTLEKQLFKTAIQNLYNSNNYQKKNDNKNRFTKSFKKMATNKSRKKLYSKQNSTNYRKSSFDTPFNKDKKDKDDNSLISSEKSYDFTHENDILNFLDNNQVKLLKPDFLKKKNQTELQAFYARAMGLQPKKNIYSENFVDKEYMNFNKEIIQNEKLKKESIALLDQEEHQKLLEKLQKDIDHDVIVDVNKPLKLEKMYDISQDKIINRANYLLKRKDEIHHSRAQNNLKSTQKRFPSIIFDDINENKPKEEKIDDIIKNYDEKEIRRFLNRNMSLDNFESQSKLNKEKKIKLIEKEFTKRAGAIKKKKIEEYGVDGNLNKIIDKTTKQTKFLQNILDGYSSKILGDVQSTLSKIYTNKNNDRKENFKITGIDITTSQAKSIRNILNNTKNTSNKFDEITKEIIDNRRKIKIEKLKEKKREEIIKQNKMKRGQNLENDNYIKKSQMNQMNQMNRMNQMNFLSNKKNIQNFRIDKNKKSKFFTKSFTHRFGSDKKEMNNQNRNGKLGQYKSFRSRKINSNRINLLKNKFGKNYIFDKNEKNIIQKLDMLENLSNDKDSLNSSLCDSIDSRDNNILGSNYFSKKSTEKYNSVKISRFGKRNNQSDRAEADLKNSRFRGLESFNNKNTLKKRKSIQNRNFLKTIYKNKEKKNTNLKKDIITPISSPGSVLSRNLSPKNSQMRLNESDHKAFKYKMRSFKKKLRKYQKETQINNKKEFSAFMRTFKEKNFADLKDSPTIEEIFRNHLVEQEDASTMIMANKFYRKFGVKKKKVILEKSVENDFNKGYLYKNKLFII